MNEIQKTEVLEVDSVNGLSLIAKTEIQNAFRPFAEQFNEWKEKAVQINVTDASQVDLMQAARESRLALVKVRKGAEKVKDELKEDSLKYGRAVMEVYNKIKDSISEIEAHLLDQEKFAEVQAAKEKAERLAERMKRLTDFPDVSEIMVQELTDNMFETFVSGLIAQREKAQKEAEEQERQAKEKQRIDQLDFERREMLLPYWGHMEESERNLSFGESAEDWFNAFYETVKTRKFDYDEKQEKIRKENERLQKENAKRQAQLKAAKEAQEKAEKELREKREAEARAEQQRKDEEARLEKEKKAAERKAKRAPDSKKINEAIDSLIFPEINLKTDEFSLVLSEIMNKFEAFKAWAKQQIEKE